MGASWVPVIIFTTIWAIVGGILPFIVPRGPQKGYVWDIIFSYWYLLLSIAQSKKVKTNLF